MKNTFISLWVAGLFASFTAGGQSRGELLADSVVLTLPKSEILDIYEGFGISEILFPIWYGLVEIRRIVYYTPKGRRRRHDSSYAGPRSSAIQSSEFVARTRRLNVSAQLPGRNPDRPAPPASARYPRQGLIQLDAQNTLCQEQLHRLPVLETRLQALENKQKTLTVPGAGRLEQNKVW